MTARRPVLRRCVACRSLTDRSELWRVVRLAGGGIQLDRGLGRSAYLCPSQACLDEARRRKRLQRALRCPVADTLLEVLQRRLMADDRAVGTPPCPAIAGTPTAASAAGFASEASSEAR